MQENENSFVICYGHFNVIHPGHMRFLCHAKTHGEKLIVALMSDSQLAKSNDGRHYFSQDERAAGAAAIETVDNVIVLDNISLEETIRAFSPLTFVMGKEFEIERRKEVDFYIDLTRDRGGKVVFHSGEISYSSKELFYGNAEILQKAKARDFNGVCQKLGISSNSLSDLIDKFDSQKILVIGDTIVDQFIACDAIGMSAEAPVVVLRELEKKQYIGGAAIVAAHINSLGAECYFMSVLGNDAPADFVKTELHRKKIKTRLFTDPQRPTTYKMRYMVENQKMFRVSRLEEQSVSAELEAEMITELQKIIPLVDGVIISDFVYGCITPDILDFVIKTAVSNNIKLFGDLQCSSQIGSVLKFRNFDLIVPTEREARIALSDHDSGIEKLAMELLERTSAKNLMITLGANGFVSYRSCERCGVNSQPYPALSANPIDTAGAGDSLLSTVALGCCAGADFMKASALGACAAAIAVNRIGNIPIASGELKRHIGEVLIQ